MQAQAYAPTNPKVTLVVTFGSPIIKTATDLGSADVLHLRQSLDPIAPDVEHPDARMSFPNWYWDDSTPWWEDASKLMFVVPGVDHDAHTYEAAARYFDSDVANGSWSTIQSAVARFTGERESIHDGLDNYGEPYLP